MENFIFCAVWPLIWCKILGLWLYEWNSFLYVTTQQSLVTIGIVVVEISFNFSRDLTRPPK